MTEKTEISIKTDSTGYSSSDTKFHEVNIPMILDNLLWSKELSVPSSDSEYSENSDTELTNSKQKQSIKRSQRKHHLYTVDCQYVCDCHCERKLPMLEYAKHLNKIHNINVSELGTADFFLEFEKKRNCDGPTIMQIFFINHVYFGLVVDYNSNDGIIDIGFCYLANPGSLKNVYSSFIHLHGKEGYCASHEGKVVSYRQFIAEKNCISIPRAVLYNKYLVERNGRLYLPMRTEIKHLSYKVSKKVKWEKLNMAAGILKHLLTTESLATFSITDSSRTSMILKGEIEESFDEFCAVYEDLWGLIPLNK